MNRCLPQSDWTFMRTGQKQQKGAAEEDILLFLSNEFRAHITYLLTDFITRIVFPESGICGPRNPAKLAMAQNKENTNE
jgi:hypothetical protein